MSDLEKTRSSSPEADMKALIWDYLDGSLSNADNTLLSQWIGEDSSHVRAFLLQVLVDQQVSESLQDEVGAQELLRSLNWDARSPSDPAILELGITSEPNQLSDSSVRSKNLWLSPLMAGVLAASVTALAFFLSGMPKWSDEPTRDLAAGIQSKAGEEYASQEAESELLDDDKSLLYAATITGMLDAHWSSAESSATYGEPLSEGRELSLDSGLVQITFGSGAKILLQGPADFTVRSEIQGRLEEGKIAAVCPRRAYGFSIRTPSAEIIDLGTAFGLQVNKLGISEVHVYDGEVVAQGLDETGELVGQLVHVTDQMAVRIAPESETVRTIRFNGKKFRRELEPLLTDDELPPLPVRRELALWLAADQLVKLDEEDRVIAWRDIQTGDNQTAEDALQHIPEIRPRMVASAINGRPALRFDGSTHLTTTPLETTDNQTLCFVLSIPTEALNRKDHGGQILNYNGPPHREISNVTQPGVLQIGDHRSNQKWAKIKRYGEFKSFVYSFGRGQGINSGMTSSRRLEPDVPIVMTYIYDRTNRKAKLFVNGVLQQSNSASVPIAITSRKVIGKHSKHVHYFIGDLAEMLIYNTALKNRERQQVDQYLMDRYHIAVPSDSGT